MSRRHIIPILAGLALALPLAAQAQAVKSGPGGQTLAGPGAVRAAGPRDFPVFRSSHNLDLCATVWNRSGADLTVVFQTLYQSGNEGEPIPVDAMSFVVPSDMAYGACNKATGRIVVQCAAADCSFDWRVDRQ